MSSVPLPPSFVHTAALSGVCRGVASAWQVSGWCGKDVKTTEEVALCLKVASLIARLSVV